jgi:hypothetical protein
MAHFLLSVLSLRKQEKQNLVGCMVRTRSQDRQHNGEDGAERHAGGAERADDGPVAVGPRPGGRGGGRGGGGRDGRGRARGGGAQNVARQNNLDRESVADSEQHEVSDAESGGGDRRGGEGDRRKVFDAEEGEESNGWDLTSDSSNDHKPTLLSTVEQFAGTKLPCAFNLSNADVLFEPYFWVELFERRQLRTEDLRDELGVPGPVATAFRTALMTYMAHRKVKRDAWLEEKAEVLCAHFAAIGRAYLRSDEEMSQFLLEMHPDFMAARHDVQHFLWDVTNKSAGPKAAAAFAAAGKVKDSDYPSFLSKETRAARSKCVSQAAKDISTAKAQRASQGAPRRKERRLL